MKRQSNKVCLAILLCVLLLGAVALTACNGSKHTLTFETNGGTELAPVQFKAGKSVTVGVTTKEYFTFNGWYADAELTTTFDKFDSMPDNDVTVYAKWTAGESGTIVFVTNGGSAVDKLTEVVGQTITAPTAPTKYGYTFAGWYSDAELTKLYVFGTMPSGTLTLYAKWSRNGNYSYVTYVLNGGQTEVPVQSNGKAVAPIVSSDVECIWYTDKNYTNEYNFNLTVNSDITLYGLKSSKGLSFVEGAVSGYTGNSKEVFVPEKHDGHTVTAVGASAFENSSLQYVNLPQSVTTIGDASFYGCEYLVKINLYSCANNDVAGKLTSIGKFAFALCVRMTSMVDVSGLSEISDSAFANCSLLGELTLGEQLTSVGENAFVNCVSLTKVSLPSSVQTVSNYAFANSGITSLNIPTSLSSWGKGVVKGCEKLSAITGGNNNYVVDSNNGTLICDGTLLLYVTTQSNEQVDSFTLPQGVTSIAPYAFYGNKTIKSLDVSDGAPTLSSLEGLLELQNLTVSDLDSANPYLAYWFGANTAQKNGSSGLLVPSSLTTVTFTAYSATNIPDYAFYGCNGLQAVNGLGDITSVGEFALGYTAFTSFNVSSEVTSIAKTAFRGTKSLLEIAVDGGSEHFSSFDGALYDETGSTLLYVPEGKTTVVFADTADRIDDGALYLSKITALTVPNEITQIGFGAFENMNSLKSLSVPFIGDGGDNSFMMYVFGAIVEEDEEDGTPTLSVNKCPASLNSITVRGDVSAIPANAFAYCSNVFEYNFANSDYTAIGKGAFFSTALKSVVIPDTVNTIDDYAFFNTDATSVVIGKGVTYIGKEAFGYMVSLESVEFKEGDNALEIAEGAFISYRYTDSDGYTHAISDLAKLTLSNNVVSIGDAAFNGAGYYGVIGRNGQYLSSVDPDATFTYIEIELNDNGQLQTIGDNAFRFSGVYSVILPKSVDTIGSFAFDSCYALSNITLNKVVTDIWDAPAIGTGTFSNSPNLKIHVPSNSVSMYKSAWSSYGYHDIIVPIEEAQQ